MKTAPYEQHLKRHILMKFALKFKILADEISF